ncbi:hypothetical protein ACC790_37800, partial [Rhizobium johnstonii]
GPGISKDAPKRTGLALFAEILVRDWWEMVKLNILFILAALFVVTLPMSKWEGSGSSRPSKTAT